MGKVTGFLEYERAVGEVTPEAQRIQNFKEFHGMLPLERQRLQAARCMNCGVPFCQAGVMLSQAMKLIKSSRHCCKKSNQKSIATQNAGNYCSTITSVFFDETITIKEAFISTEDKIFTSESELTQYLLYGTNEQQKQYTVKVGEDLRKIADDHKLNIAELLIANPKFPSGNALLAPGEVLNVGLINPLINVTYRKIEVSDTPAAYETEYVDDSTKYVEYMETKQQGKEGITRITKDVQYTNGEMRKVNITKQELVKAPLNKIIVRGTKKHYAYQGTPPSPISAGDFMWPTNIPYVITTRYEYRWGTFHKGIDISGTGWGSPIYSSTDGVVYSVTNTCAAHGSISNKCGGGGGNNIRVATNLGYDVVYMHLLQNILVREGQKVTKGQVIAYMGSSGSSTGCHLHFEVDYAGTRNSINPCKVLPRC